MARVVVIGSALLFVAGCGFPESKVQEAKGHVQRALEVWQKDGKPSEVKALSPAVEFNEAMWNAGEKLISFEMGAVRYVDAVQAVRCDVRLTLRKGKGKERTESVAYDVTLGPPVKVVNNPMP
jgi:hypothetical protein